MAASRRKTSKSPARKGKGKAVQKKKTLDPAETDGEDDDTKRSQSKESKSKKGKRGVQPHIVQISYYDEVAPGSADYGMGLRDGKHLHTDGAGDFGLELRDDMHLRSPSQDSSTSDANEKRGRSASRTRVVPPIQMKQDLVDETGDSGDDKDKAAKELKDVKGTNYGGIQRFLVLFFAAAASYMYFFSQHHTQSFVEIVEIEVEKKNLHFVTGSNKTLEANHRVVDDLNWAHGIDRSDAYAHFKGDISGLWAHGRVLDSHRKVQGIILTSPAVHNYKGLFKGLLYMLHHKPPPVNNLFSIRRDPGDYFAFKGDKGAVTVSFKESKIKQACVFHPWNAAQRHFAMHKFKLVGWKENPAKHIHFHKNPPIDLGNFTYNYNGPILQCYRIDSPDTDKFRAMTFQVLSNFNGKGSSANQINQTRIFRIQVIEE